jgi:LDH2 family malate/lactate/ureidoglycolate dehydrogenase
MGIPAMAMGVDKGTSLAKEHGMAVVGVTHCAHTGRLGAFCEQGAAADCLTITFGGGARRNWRQVVPYGGARAKLPTNPYGFGIPGGDRGPVILDFATSAAAGGWIYLAKSAGGRLPEGLIVDARGKPSTDPDDYLNGGALLPAAGAKGYGLGLMAELVGEALLGRATTEMNWIILLVDTTRYWDDSTFKRAAESVLSDIRECPAADGFDRVEIPGERERALEKIHRKEGVPTPAATWDQIVMLAEQLDVRSVR